MSLDTILKNAWPAHPAGGRWRWLAALVLALTLGACGGGVEGQGTGSFGYSQGPITGFGSIVVNGVHYDDSAASIQSDDGVTLSRDDLKLGMTVEVSSGAIDQTAGTAVASAVSVRSELLGPITASDATAGTLTVLGQTVRISASTVFDARISGRQAGLSVGQLVEVYAIADPVSGVYAARRIEPVSSASTYKIRGTVSNLAAASFKIGAATFAYSGGLSLSNGQQVRLKLAKALDGQGRYVVASSSDDTPRVDDGTEVEIEGSIASYASASRFVVAGLTVDASSATLKPSTATLAAGVRVEVEGVMSGGVLVARKVEVKTGDDDSGSGSGGDDAVEFEFEGRITALDASARTFVIRGETVSYAGSVRYEGGTEGDLAVGVVIEVKGTLASDGVTFEATRIQFDD